MLERPKVCKFWTTDIWLLALDSWGKESDYSNGPDLDQSPSKSQISMDDLWSERQDWHYLTASKITWSGKICGVPTNEYFVYLLNMRLH